MSYSDPAHWRGRAEELRGLAEAMQESVSKQMMGKMAEDYECLARTAEQRAKDCPPKPAVVVVPLMVRSFARPKHPIRARLASICDAEIPGFLKRGPATAEEVGAPLSIVPEL